MCQYNTIETKGEKEREREREREREKETERGGRKSISSLIAM